MPVAHTMDKRSFRQRAIDKVARDPRTLWPFASFRPSRIRKSQRSLTSAFKLLAKLVAFAARGFQVEQEILHVESQLREGFLD